MHSKRSGTNNKVPKFGCLPNLTCKAHRWDNVNLDFKRFVWKPPHTRRFFRWNFKIETIILLVIWRVHFLLANVLPKPLFIICFLTRLAHNMICWSLIFCDCLLNLFSLFQNYGAFFDLWGAGITGPVMLKGQKSTTDLSSNDWTYQVFLVFCNDYILHNWDSYANEIRLTDQILRH